MVLFPLLSASASRRATNIEMIPPEILLRDGQSEFHAAGVFGWHWWHCPFQVGWQLCCKDCDGMSFRVEKVNFSAIVNSLSKRLLYICLKHGIIYCPII
jgi:hypothetical protein